ncbi:MAG: tyrosine-type recombinase/integrase [Actinomycetota bacterium]
MATAEAFLKPEATLGEYLLTWLAHMTGRVRLKTLEGYEALIHRHAIPVLGEIPLRELHPLHLQRLYGALMARGTLAAGTVLNLHLVLTQALGQAHRWGLIPTNPAAAAQPPRPRRAEPVVPDAALVTRLLREVQGTWFAVPVTMAIATGMRRGEVLGLRWSDLDVGLTVAHVRRSLQVVRGELLFAEPKTRRSRRSVPLPSLVRPLLADHRRDQEARREEAEVWEDHDLVLDRGNGRPVNPGTLSSGWHRFCRLRGLPPVRFHDLRHGHATLMLLQGVHPKVVSERLGHANIGITLDIYSHVLPTMQAEAVRAFDALFPGAAQG